MTLTADQISQLNRLRIFRDVETDVFRRWAQRYRLAVRTHREGVLVALRGDPYEQLIVLLTGRLTASMVDAEGRQLTIETLEGPELVAAPVLFASRNILPVDLTAETEARLMQVPARAVLSLCHDSEPFLGAYLRDAGDRIMFLAEKIRFLQFQSLRQKVAAFLLEKAENDGERSVRLPYSMDRLADLFGVARPSLSRVFSELVDDGLLEREGRRYRIRKPEDLARLVRAA